MKKQPQVTAQTRENLLEAFWELYRENKIEKITVKEISSKAGYNRGTFYEYFTDVYNVLEELENKLIPSFNELPPVMTQSGVLGMPLDNFLMIWEQNAKYYAVLLGSKGDPAFSSKLKNSIKPIIISELKDRLNVSVREFDYILEFTLSAMIGTMVYWFSNENKLSWNEIYKLIHDLLDVGMMRYISS